ncbi:cytochrome P450 [Nocardia wallacei]|uniref:cytochrome P450 n=1 Tax=Nocardia wallacei TaxID=480035 RepID=UPI002454C172|nr:cytochrome P450 [Nocardia wallacei]
MTTPPRAPGATQSAPGSCPVAQGSPIRPDVPHFLLHSDQFAADPHAAYSEMRGHHRSLVPVELAPDVPATLVIGYRMAVQILHDHEHFSSDPRTWQQGVAEDCPVLPMLAWRPNALFNTGSAHERYREPSVAAIESVDLYAMHGVVERIAVPLINTFCGFGEADLLEHYIRPLVRHTLDHMLGCTPEIGERVSRGAAMMFDAQGNAEVGNKVLLDALREHVAFRRIETGSDITSELLSHPVGLDDEEIVHQLATMYATGQEPGVNLIANTLRYMLTDDKFADDLLSGSLATRDALDTVLSTDPPLANYCVTYPRQSMLMNDEVWLPAHQPVMISMAAAGNDPAVSTDDRTGNRSHLAWGAGPHMCPAKSVAYLVAQDAIDQLLDALPEIQLAVPAEELVWRPGPFHRSLAELPVIFPKSPPLTVIG